MPKQEKEILDQEIRRIAENPSIGEEKKGDLRGVFVHKFKLKTTQYLLAYRKLGEDLELVMIGPHENYYRDLKQYLKSR
jgi:plasmid stabilization system protein ParE